MSERAKTLKSNYDRITGTLSMFDRKNDKSSDAASLMMEAKATSDSRGTG